MSSQALRLLNAGGRHAEVIVVAMAAAATLALYIWSNRYWVDLTDEGYFLALADRVRGGELPYRDFDTYYTPGIFYLYAAALDLFGPSILTVRDLMAGVRTACALLLYGLTRRLAPPPFAVLPFLLIAVVDPIPVFPEPHPAWFGLLLTLATMETIARHRASGWWGWLAGAGAAAGLAYLFKQNVGAFAALAVGGYLLLRDREGGRLMMAIRAAFVLGVGTAMALLLRPAFSPLIAATVWLPGIVMLAVLFSRGQDRVGVTNCWTGVRPVLVEGALVGAAFVAVTLLWLVPLTLALGPRATPFGLFVGAVNQGALILPLEPPPRAARELALISIWLPLALAALGRAVARHPSSASSAAWTTRFSPLRRPLIGALSLSLVVPWLPTVSGPRETLAEDPSFFPWLDWLDARFGTLYVYLPGLAAWAGLATLVPMLWRPASGKPERIGQREPTDLVCWYLLVGTLALLALYPRSDTLHAMFAGPPLFVVGAWALHRFWRRLSGGLGWAPGMAVFAALLVVPVAAVAPHAYWRYVTIIHADPRSPTPPPYIPLGLERAPVLAPRHIADNIRGAVEFVRAGTPPGDPFFAYPAVPMFNFLADRPNPTRFNHFFPGALTPDDLNNAIERLETSRPRYVLWDHGGVVYWHTEPANRRMSEYIWRCYGQVANFPPFLILERRGC